jgi:dienelactone hydrolase
METFKLKSLTAGGGTDVVIVYPKGPAGEKFPVIVYGHGMLSTVTKLFEKQFKTIASYGFIVVAPNSCPVACDFRKDMMATLDGVGITPVLHPALSTADLSRTGIMGYSNGAAASYSLSTDKATLSKYNAKAVVVQHEGCEEAGRPPRRCGTPQVPIMFTSGSLEVFGPMQWANTNRAYRSATQKPSVFISLAGAAHVPVDFDDTEPIAQFMSCWVRGEQSNCDKIFGQTGRAVCNQSFALRNPDGSPGCSVNQTKYDLDDFVV